ncbi:hypothetical protein [Metasolibacillus sp.]|uniref:hypothetical protein n=1 Tax=Metasolibacillus sp. TaxID=2703680 RepID=UPI0025D62901|nr:hypothetical protein [Metasolibacillus sp.]MCT6925269.1 hypothetical protein [Metasolibacillus sp.]MCT6941501.1 hypothetical protein [Metasolibacillus sp.]
MITNIKYSDLIKTAIKETYVQATQRKLLEKLKNQVITYEESIFTYDLVHVQKTQTFGEIFNLAMNSYEEKTIQIIQELEYELAFKYATLYTINSPILGKLDKLLKEGKILDATSLKFSEDYVTDWTYQTNLIPSFKKYDDTTYFLKFSNAISGHKTAENSSRVTIKYPIIVVYYSDLDILEIRLDNIKGYLRRGDEYFYSKQISKVISWFQIYLDITPLPLDIGSTIDIISNADEEHVNVFAKELKYRSGSKVVLDTGRNDSTVLPLLGDLKQIISENDDLFKSCINTGKIQKLLSDFIDEIEESSDSPWISLRWNDELSNKALKVKFSFNYKEKNIDLLQYYNSSSTEMERMNYVTKYLVEYKRKYENQEFATPISREVIKDATIFQKE